MQPGTLNTSALSPQQVTQLNELMDELPDLPTDQRLAALRPARMMIQPLPPRSAVARGSTRIQ
jgi:hypothetical protein